MSELKSTQSQNIHDPIETADQDVLGRKELAKTILERISQSDAGVFGIYGGWGTGKTSLLHLMRGLNLAGLNQSPNNKVHVEIIDAWQYESTGNLLIPIIVQLKKLASLSEFQDSWSVIAKRITALTGLSLVDTALRTISPLSIADIGQLHEQLKSKETQNYQTILLDWEQAVDTIAEEKEAFEKIVNLTTDKLQCGKLILCVDNLDRCVPDKVITLLESIKLFLSVPNCVWVFAMDAEVVASYVSRKYDGTRMDGYSYLDKIIPEQYHLALSPAADGGNILQLLRQVAGRTLSDFNERNIPQIPKTLVPRRLIKSARKVMDFYGTRYTGSVAPETVFHLSMLYHTWPEFYQRLSSTSDEQVRGVLDNFFVVKEPAAPEKNADVAKPIRKNIELDKKFIEDPDLAHFLKTTFKDYTSARFMNELIDGMTGLRLTGLP